MTNRKLFWLLVLVLTLLCVSGCEKSPQLAGQSTITAPATPWYPPKAVSTDEALRRILDEVQAVRHPVRAGNYRLTFKD